MTAMDSPRTYGEVEGFINMLLAACEDASMNETLEMLLSQPDDRRRAIVAKLLDRLRERKAPQNLVEAMACLLDDDVAEKAYAAIHECARKPK
jgi:hypothetical protein